MEAIEILRISLTTMSYLVFTGIMVMAIVMPMVQEEPAEA
jgi:hypothetical protein